MPVKTVLRTKPVYVLLILRVTFSLASYYYLKYSLGKFIFRVFLAKRISSAIGETYYLTLIGF